MTLTGHAADKAASPKQAVDYHDPLIMHSSTGKEPYQLIGYLAGVKVTN